MDYNNTTSSFDSFELQLTPVAQGFLKETAKWAKFLAIVGFIFVGLYIIMAIAMFAMGGAMSSAASEMEGMEGMEGMSGMGAAGMMGGAFLGVIYLLVAILYFFPMLYLYKFASKTQFALNNSNTDELTNGLENLKSHYKFMGILMLIALIFMALFVLLAIIGIGAAAAM